MMGTVGEPVRAFGLVALDPLVAGLPADVMASAEFSDGEVAAEPLENETSAFDHGIGLQPGHGRLLCRGPR
jgi:hypothetical protein